MAINVTRSLGAYIAPNMCMSMVISVGTTRKVGGCIGAPKKRLGTVVAICSGDTSVVPIWLPLISIRMKR